MARPRAASRRGGAGESVRIDAREFTELYTRMKQADKVIAKRMRKTLKSAADDAVKAVRDAALEAPPAKVQTRNLIGRKRKVSTRVRSRGMRAALAKATAASLTKTNLTVRTSQKKMPAGMGPMVKAWNSARFRHPVWGNRRKWVYQNGATYFTRGRDESLGDLRKALSVAMEKAAQELAD